MLEYVDTHAKEEHQHDEEKGHVHNEHINKTWDDLHNKLADKFHKISHEKGVKKAAVKEHLNIFNHKIGDMVKKMKKCANCMAGKHCSIHHLSKKIEKKKEDKVF